MFINSRASQVSAFSSPIVEYICPFHLWIQRLVIFRWQRQFDTQHQLLRTNCHVYSDRLHLLKQSHYTRLPPFSSGGISSVRIHFGFVSSTQPQSFVVVCTYSESERPLINCPAFNVHYSICSKWNWNVLIDRSCVTYNINCPNESYVLRTKWTHKYYWKWTESNMNVDAVAAWHSNSFPLSCFVVDDLCLP